MNTAEPSSDADPLVELAEEFADRYRRGERPALTEYTDRYPAHAERIRKLFPAMLVMEEFGTVVGPDSGPPGVGEAPPRQLGEYRILREVGRGGMGVVYEAVQESLGRHVALKVLPSGNWKSPTQVERFRREARAVARLHHTNIVPVFGVGECDGVHYYAMQFIHGQGLDNVLSELKKLRRAGADKPCGQPPADTPDNAKPASIMSAGIAEGLLSGAFPEAEATHTCANAPAAPAPSATSPPTVSRVEQTARGPHGDRNSTSANHSELTTRSDAEYARGVARVGVQAAEALAYAHAQGILHRDIKPANLLLDTQGIVWVTDFGLAKAVDGGELTGTGDIIGTIRYMAPERFRGEADPRSDIYGLGLTLYEMLTLRPAFEGADRPRLIECIAHKAPPAPRALDPQIPRDLETIVLKAIAKDPAHRYATAAELAEDLRRFLTDRPILARRTTWTEHAWRWCRRNPAVAGLLTAVSLLLVGLVGVLAVSNARIGAALEQKQWALGEETRARGEEKRTRENLEQTLYYRWIASAADARDKKRNALAEELLERCPPHLRGWEWHYLKRLPFASVPVLNHGDNITLRITYSPDGALLAVGSRNGSVSVWDAGTGKPILAPFQAQAEFIRGLAFSPAGRYLATGGWDDTVKLWNPRTGAPARQFPIGRRAVLLALTFSPDGKWLAASDQERTIHVWEVESGARSEIRTPDPLAISGLEFSADGRQLLAVSTEGIVTAWNLATRVPTHLIGAGLPAVNNVAYSPDRRLIALGSEDGIVKVLKADPWEVIWTLEADTGAALGLAFGAGGARLATSALDTTIRFWDMRTGQEALAAEYPDGRWNGLAFSPDGQRLAGGTIAGTVRILDGTPLDGPGTGAQVLALEGHNHMVAWLAYSPDGRRIASASWDGTARVWDIHSRRELRTLRASEHPLTAVAFSRDSRRVATAGWDGAVRVWDADTGEELYPPLRAGAGPVYGLAFGPDNRTVVSAHHDGKVRVWDVATGQPPGIVAAHNHPVLGLAFGPDGEFLVTAEGKNHSGKVWKWKTESLEPVLTLNQPSGILRNPVFSPDGRHVVAITSVKRVVWLWDVTPGPEKEREAKQFTLPGTGTINQAFFYPESRRIVVVAADQVQLLNPDTAMTEPLHTPHAGDIGCAALSPDRRFLATGAGYRDRGEVRIWDLSKLVK